MGKKLGFTLIELIVVIAILGILAIGLIVALNPIEQINRATDTTTLTTARAFISAVSQFQTNKLYSPACPDITCTAYDNSLNSTSSVTMASLNTVNASLYAAGAADSANDFTAQAQSATIFVSVTNASPMKDATFVVCWKPQSKVLKSDADVNNPNTTVYNDIGAIQSASACPANNSNSCYRCLKQ